MSKIKTLRNLMLMNTEITGINNLSELANLVELSISSSKVNSLKGIERLKKLKIVGFDNNNIYDITELANNENLQKINLKDIEDIISNINLNITNWDTLTNCTTSKITKLSSGWNTINSIIDASSLLVLDKTTKIDLTRNINLSQESKKELEIRFGNNVSF